MSTESTLIHRARPFLKWAGGKGQLLHELEKRVPDFMRKSRSISFYIEPFVGGGAFFFHLQKKYDIDKSLIMDVNPELILTYRMIQSDVEALIDRLNILEREYHGLKEKQKENFFYTVRTEYNEKLPGFDYDSLGAESLERSAQLIFLNKTCYNGLFRQNSKGEFNTPFGRYRKPSICDASNLREVSLALECAEIRQGDFDSIRPHLEKEALVYLDPPYRPLNSSSSFTAYSRGGFDDSDQKRLKRLFDDIHAAGAYGILSNSDPRNQDPENDFFDSLYRDYRIERVKASRMINSDPTKRGQINEIIISNTGV